MTSTLCIFEPYLGPPLPAASVPLRGPTFGLSRISNRRAGLGTSEAWQAIRALSRSHSRRWDGLLQDDGWRAAGGMTCAAYHHPSTESCARLPLRLLSATLPLFGEGSLARTASKPRAFQNDGQIERAFFEEMQPSRIVFILELLASCTRK
ncbi:hypothetical protein IE81DRAFT_48411 [Ceraceosorus guamensis]|uniref:Uncharacterized protein n=1 Tax=Ceraceosorus guamensis TaxID=1522189 RepID=A0A316VNJ9_9BASI|nr:hypothetical protein IE81DRAFT_48411 [Ceraceosorus guamensis]PWN39147.1 hypothetical protein IE81DRAFT_48411 [Ceraceosorus guamensis]